MLHGSSESVRETYVYMTTQSIYAMALCGAMLGKTDHIINDNNDINTSNKLLGIFTTESIGRIIIVRSDKRQSYSKDESRARNY